MKLPEKLIIAIFLLSVIIMANDSLMVDFRSERHRTEWNWVEYRITLKNIATKTIKNPVIRYFAENTNIQYCEKNANNVGCNDMKIGNYGLDSMLAVTVDYTSYPFQTNSKITSAGKYTVVDLKTKGSLKPGKTLTMHFRLYRKDWGTWNCSRDFSYQKNATVKEKNYFMAVFDEGYKILWGYDPLNSLNQTGNVVWSSRNKSQVIERFKGDTDMVMPAGRFWILKDSVFTPSEKDSLHSKGVDVYEVSTYQGQTLLFCRNSAPIRVKSLQQKLSGFYNTFSVDDSTSLSLVLRTDDLYEKKRICNDNGSCEDVVEERQSYKIEATCWSDVGMFACKDIVKSCGGSDALIDRQVVLATIPRDSVSCLLKNQNVRDLQTEKTGILFDTDEDDTNKVNYSFSQVANFNDNVYKKMRLLGLQYSPAWNAALKENVKMTTWLSGDDYKYTGEGIIVGIYDGRIDFRHPAFQEYDAEKRTNVPRQASWVKKDDREYNKHGTKVAGVVGGNGSGSPNSMFRGIAPKITFYPGDLTYKKQYGHVVNHSRGLPENEEMICIHCKNHPLDSLLKLTFYYGINTRTVDQNIFGNWKLFTESGDYLTKTIVQSAGNNGVNPQYGFMRGAHSILATFKNTITVGSINVLNNTVSDFSSLGPTWDGRIKPDIMANGDSKNIVAPTVIAKGTIEDYDYDFFSGTSAAAPIVSGVVALMYQKFKEKTGLSLNKLSMRNSTTKAMLIHSADDMKGSHWILDVAETLDEGSLKTSFGKGPDFITGWGSVNAKGALDIIDNYDASSQKFERFREFEIYNGMIKKWTFNIPAGSETTKARVTLVWDDAVPSMEDVSIEHFTDKKLVNDLDMYLVSPSGKRYYPWKLDPLSTDDLEYVTASKDKNGLVKIALAPLNSLLMRTDGYEAILLEDAEKGAYKCKKDDVNRDCFDHLNNVEVVDVEGDFEGELIETGEWQVVVEGYKVVTGNSADGFAQVASIVSDFKLEEPSCFNDTHPYLRNRASSCVHELGDYLENYVTFDSRTYVAPGDWIYLYDSADHMIGAYTGLELAGKKITVKTRTIKVVLESNDDDQQGWGYAINKVEHMPYDVLTPLLHDIRRMKK